MSVINGIIETVNPKGGQGVTETIVVIIIVLALAIMAIMQIEAPQYFRDAFMIVLAWLFGRNSNPKNRKAVEVEDERTEQTG